MGGVESKAPPPFDLTCCRDLMREFMYNTAAERGRGGRGEGGEGREREHVCVHI